MPFHSDAEDFDERAFEEATKVRSLEELAAQSAALEGLSSDGGDQVSDDAKTATKVMPPDELAARRHAGGGRADSMDTPLAEPPPEKPFAPRVDPDRESAPGLPSPPEAARPRMLDTTPARTTQPSTPPENAEGNRTKLGMEPAKAATRSAAASMNDAVPKAVANEPSRPIAPKRPSSAPIILGILLVVAGGLAAIYFVFLKNNTTTSTTTPDKGSAIVDNNGSAGSAIADNGSAGSAVAMNGSDTGSAGSAGAMTGSNTGSAVAMTGSAAHPVDTVIAASVAKGATVEIEGTDMKGPAPFTAKLEKDQQYKARVTAPGFLAQEIEIKGGQAKVTAKLAAKPKTISVTTDPAGADILIDGVPTSKLTPSDVTLTGAQATRPRTRVTLRRPGYKATDQYLDAKAWSEGDLSMSAKVDVKLTVAPKIVPNNNGGTTNNNNAGSGATTPAGGGSGSATTPTGGGTSPTGGGTGSAAGTTGGGTTTPPSGGTTTPPAGGTTPPAGGTTTPPAGGTTTPPATGSASGGQTLK
jgi:hypothetical protein